MPALCLAASLTLAGCQDSLHDVVASGNLGRARAILARDPNLVHGQNALGKTPLHYAVHYKQIEAMSLLVEYGAGLDTPDRTGMTPLHTAALLGRQEEAAWLLAHGADAASTDVFGDTPVHTAAIFGQGGVIEGLAAHGANLTEPNHQGRTPLDLARENRHSRVAHHLERLIRASGPPPGTS